MAGRPVGGRCVQRAPPFSGRGAGCLASPSSAGSPGASPGRQGPGFGGQALTVTVPG